MIDEGGYSVAVDRVGGATAAVEGVLTEAGEEGSCSEQLLQCVSNDLKAREQGNPIEELPKGNNDDRLSLTQLLVAELSIEP